MSWPSWVSDQASALGTWALCHAAELESWAKIVAIFGGGSWALYRFGLLRKGETALDLKLSYRTLDIGGGFYLVTFDVTLANKGGVQIAAKQTLFPSILYSPEYVAYEDKHERLHYPADLLLREITPGSERLVTWFPPNDTGSPKPTDVELDLLREYELDQAYTFWMEPKEKYHLSATARVQPGLYLAMATFVGKRPDEDFWRRTFVIEVPRLRKKRATQTQPQRSAE